MDRNISYNLLAGGLSVPDDMISTAAEGGYYFGPAGAAAGAAVGLVSSLKNNMFGRMIQNKHMMENFNTQ
jgi:sugar/nucleoside kinase (ribokinase family)